MSTRERSCYEQGMNLAQKIFGLGVLSLLGCSTALEVTRSATYPVDFAYIDRATVRTEMHAIASKVYALDIALRKDPAPETQEVDAILQEIAHIANALNPGRPDSNHPLLSKHLPQFLEDVAAARRGLEAHPPNYFMAGSISGSCIYCHR